MLPKERFWPSSVETQVTPSKVSVEELSRGEGRTSFGNSGLDLHRIFWCRLLTPRMGQTRGCGSSSHRAGSGTREGWWDARAEGTEECMPMLSHDNMGEEPNVDGLWITPAMTCQCIDQALSSQRNAIVLMANRFSMHPCSYVHCSHPSTASATSTNHQPSITLYCLQHCDNHHMHFCSLAALFLPFHPSAHEIISCSVAYKQYGVLWAKPSSLRASQHY